MLTDNDDFLAGFNEGLKLRKTFPQAPEPFKIYTGKDGMTVVKIPEKYKETDCRVSAALNRLGRIMRIETTCLKARGTSRLQALFYAERPIFQAGECVRIKGILRQIDHTGIHLPEQKEYECMLWHRKELYGVFKAVPNTQGTVVFEKQLPMHAAAGAYHITIGHQGKKYPVFRVDKNEKALINLRVKPASDTVTAGSTIRGQVEATRAGLAPAKGMQLYITV